jgi:GntR family transcriptional regulator, transcriptional repressor for pyruvate dehydrogenase complex
MSAQPERLRPLRRRPRMIRGASEQVAVQIQHYIQDEHLQPGDFLGREEDLAAEFGVSRPTLREALKLLASGKLIRASKGPGGGIFVAHTADEGIGLSLSDAIGMMLETGSVSLEELLDARLLLEVPLVGLAANQADEDQLARLRAALREPAERAAADADFHKAIAAAAGNRMLQALTGWVYDVVQPSLNRELEGALLESVVDEQHEELLNAIEKGDAARAERAMKDHLLYLRDVLRMVRQSDDEKRE